MRVFNRYGWFVIGPVILSALPGIGLFLFYTSYDPRLAIVLGAVPVAGTYLFFSGFADYRLRAFVRDTPTSKIRSLAQGAVEVYGKARPHGEMLRSPFSGKDCVFYRYEVEEYRQQGKHSSWVTIDEGKTDRLFAIEDETGSVLVDPKGADLRLPQDNQVYVSGGDKPPEPVQEFIDHTDAVDSEDHSLDLKVFELSYGNRRRYTEWFIAPDAGTYVYGTAMNAVIDGEERTVINRDESTPLFTISDTSEKHVLNSMRNKMILKLLAGFGMLCFSAFMGYRFMTNVF